jgi:hypothetical protein
MDEERQSIEAMVGLEKASLEVVRKLERVLTILSDISMIFYENFHHHLSLTIQITFNVRKK